MPTTEFRQTGVIAKVIDENLNSWEDFAGEDINVEVAYKYAAGDGPDEWEQGYWGYRGQSAICVTVDLSKIVRVRIGDGTSADRTIYKQEITDPSDVSQWTAWTQLYTGDHFAVAIEATTGAGFRVIHAKDDGVYVNNVKKITHTGVTRIKPLTQAPAHIYYQAVDQDIDGDRRLQWYYCPDVTSVIAGSLVNEEPANYRWYRHDMGGIVHLFDEPDNAEVFNVHSIAMEGGSRNKSASQSLVNAGWWFDNPANGPANVWDGLDVLVGPSGQAGYKTYSNIYVNAMTGGYYLFYSEQHRDAAGNVLSNLRMPLMWSRALGIPWDWAEPVPVGYTIWGFGGAVELSAFIYVCGNGRVLRRTNVSTEYDITDYVLEGNFDQPRDNQKATGTLVCANPDNVVGTMLGLIASTEAGLTERRLDLQLGLKYPKDADYTWKKNDSWWVSSLSKSKTEKQYRLTLSFANFWQRLENPFRDSINIPGQINWKDWQDGGVNQTYNYTNETDEFLRIAEGDAYKIRTIAGDTLFTGWRGENGIVDCRFLTTTNDTGRIVFRYKDKNNYYFAEVRGDAIKLGQVSNGDRTVLESVAQARTAGFNMQVDFRWKNIDVYYNGHRVIHHRLANPIMLVGFVGFGKVDDANFDVHGFNLTEPNRPLATSDLMRRLLHRVEEFGVVISDDLPNADQINVLWGPQSDLDTPAKALQQLLETSKIDIAWRPEGSVADPDARFWISRFEKDTGDYTFQDQVIEYTQVNEGRKRPNVVSVDGNDDSWTEYDRADLTTRDRPVNVYLDLPELKNPGEVRARAQQEIIDARRFNSPGGRAVWYPQYTRKDTVYWIDEDDNTFLTLIEGLAVEFNQSLTPFQRATIDTGTFIYCPPDVPGTFIAKDSFQRTQSDWGDAQVGGTWVIE